MKVRATCTLKNSSVGIISTGTIFEGTEETLPEFVLDELRKKRGTFEVLVETGLIKKKKKKKKAAQKSAPETPTKLEVETSSKGKPALLREKLNSPEK